jgi:hypothetical protein
MDKSSCVGQKNEPKTIFFVNKRENIYYLENFKKVHLSLLATCSATAGKPEQVARKNI